MNMKGHGRTWAETLGSCFLKCLLCLYVLLFITEAEDSIVDDRRLAYILQTICRTVDEQYEIRVIDRGRPDSPAHTSCPHFKILPLFS